MVDASSAGFSESNQVSHGLNLHLQLADPTQMPALMAAIASKESETSQALRMLNFVHFARFLPTPDNATLQVITSFDGSLEAYVLDFVIAIGPIFDAILGFVKDHPPLPVKDHPEAFFNFVKRNNRVSVQPPALVWDDYPVFSAYPDLTVVDILGPRKTPPPVRPVTPSVVPLDDVQGNIIRGYRAAVVHHFSLRVQDGPAARAFLTQLVDGNGQDLPRVTSAEVWDEKPPYMLNVSVSAQGLRALGVPAGLIARFPEAFLQGPAHQERASNNGDVGASAPEHWEIGGPSNSVHLMVSLFSNADEHSQKQFARAHEQLLKAFSHHHLTLVHHHRAQAMLEGRVHFGYVDGIAQPRLAGVDSGEASDLQPLASVGEFLLGQNYTSVYGGSSLGDLPASLCENATYVAVRVLDQDVAAFESVLDQVSVEQGVDREWVAAKMMGRWRDGKPLAQSPTGLGADGQPVPQGINAFDYAPSLAYPNQTNDHVGLQCPVGSHIRRMNPRSSLVAGQPYSRRIIRRGMPYGSPWDASKPNERRGLFGLFLCADLSRQFEFLIQQWANTDSSASGLRGTQDPIIGSQDLGGLYRIAQPDGAAPIEFKLPRLVNTKGSLYMLMPGLGGLRWLAQGAGFDDTAAHRIGPAQWLSEAPQVQTRSRLVPEIFDPLNPDFVANPYPYYALFRKHAPVVKVARGDYQSYWVFSHELCAQAASDPYTFLKNQSAVPLAGRGLFFMDSPQHQVTRQALNPLFAQAIQNIAQSAQERSVQALTNLAQPNASFDLVSQYANPVTRDVFMRMFGIPEPMWETLGNWVETMLACFNPMLSIDRRAPQYTAAAQVLGYFGAMSGGCPAHQPSTNSGLFCAMQSLVNTPALSTEENVQTAMNFALGGYLSSAFLVSTAVFNILSRPAVLQQYLQGDAALKNQAIEELKRFDAPFQMADRYAATSITFGGELIPKDALVTLVYGAANRDEMVFGATADSLDIERVIDQKQNFVFGHGEHACIGAPMASQVVPVVVNALLEHFPALSIDSSNTEFMTDPYFRALSRLNLKS
jgi:cytochrome P450/deferrochelatase/peroxidase EfeB